MRLIDADNLEECKEIMTTVSGESKYAVRMDDIRNMPTVERPYGEWKYNPYGYLAYYKCTNCGDFGMETWHFCPNCGADMRKEEKTATWTCYDRTGFLGTDDMPYEYECSNCKKRFPEPTEECPNCRAKMEVEHDTD